MRNRIFLVINIIVLSIPLIQIASKEQLLSTGQPLLLELVVNNLHPLVQDQRLVLRYDLAMALKRDAAPPRGTVVVRLDEQHIAHFTAVLLSDRRVGANERVINYRSKRGEYYIGADSVAIPNALLGKHNVSTSLQRAKYAELRLARNGNTVWMGLRDNDFRFLPLE